HVPNEAREPLGEQRLVFGGYFHPTLMGDVRPVGGASTGLGKTPTEIGDQETGEDRDPEGKTPPVTAEVGAEEGANGQPQPQAHVVETLLDRKGLSATF